jgi:hypothetical protein
MDELRRVCSGHIIMFCSPENMFFKPDEIAYWTKTPSTKNYSRHLGRFVEYILIERHGDTFNTDLHWSNYTGVYTDMIQTKQVHPFEKPLSLMERLVLIYSKPGDTVFDPFMGSCKTGQACLNTGRDFIGCEILEEYLKLAQKNTASCNHAQSRYNKCIIDRRMMKMKRSTNFNQWRKAGTIKDVADLFEKFGVTADDLRQYQKEKAGVRRRKYTCPRCDNYVESEISNYDNSTVCPSCENDVIVDI